MVVKEEGGWEREDWEFGISRCKLLYIGWVNNGSYNVAQGIYSISCDKP